MSIDPSKNNPPYDVISDHRGKPVTVFYKGNHVGEGSIVQILYRYDHEKKDRFATARVSGIHYDTNPDTFEKT